MRPTHLLGIGGPLCGRVPERNTKAIPASIYYAQRQQDYEPEPPVCGWCTLVYSTHAERLQEAIRAEQIAAIATMAGRRREKVIVEAHQALWREIAEAPADTIGMRVNYEGVNPYER